MGVALACGLAGALAIAAPAETVTARRFKAIALALVCCTVALLYCAPARRLSFAPAAVALASGALSAVAATIGPELGGFAIGLLSSLSLIGGGVAICEHSTSGSLAAQRFLRVYVRGLFGKTAFGAVFAVLAVHVGAPAALVLGIVLACMLSHNWRSAMPSPHSLQR